MAILNLSCSSQDARESRHAAIENPVKSETNQHGKDGSEQQITAEIQVVSAWGDMQHNVFREIIQNQNPMCCEDKKRTSSQEGMHMKESVLNPRTGCHERANAAADCQQIQQALICGELGSVEIR